MLRRCGDPQERLSTHGHLFGEWIDHGASDRATPVNTVEAEIGEYLASAARVGKARGSLVGVLIGTVGALIAVLIMWMVS